MTGILLLDAVLLAVPTAALAWWWQGSRSRELAIRHARRSCRNQGVQLLDETVALVQTRLVRDSQGRRRLQRHYRFEYTSRVDARIGSDPGHRDRGEVTMLGYQLQRVLLPWIRDAEGNRIFNQ